MNKTSKRVELVTELKEIEIRKDQFETQLSAVKSPHFERGEVAFATQTRDYDHKGTEESILFDNDSMIDYLKAEIRVLTRRSESIIEELSH